MNWLKLINNEAFKEWLISTGSSSTLPQGDFRLDPFGSSLRKFNNAHSWLEVLSSTGVFTPTGRKSQAISDLSSAELLQSDETFTDFGKLVYDKWEEYSIPAGNADYEIHRCLLIISTSFNVSNSVYKDYYSRWLELRKIFSFNFLINNKVYLYLFSYLDKNAVGFNPFQFIKSLNLSETDFTSTVDWTSIKTYYSDASVDTAVDKYESTINGYLSREGRSSMCIAMELFNSNQSEREAIITEIGITSPVLDVLNDILADIKPISGAFQKIYYGAPGTGKSYKVNNLINGKDDRMHRVTFHPEYDYASFIGGYKPTMVVEDGKEVIKYKFVPQAFTDIYVKAWNDPYNQYYLVIEEINRGNCAEIFGDIFQLLDRDSDYDITPSIELEGYLKKILSDENKGLESGKLKLPNNLTIYATMNTSDQSLFPMDSAFKRRWDWEYIPICYEELTDEGKPNPSFNYNVDLDNGTSFKWNEFISKVNLNHIQQNPVLGMDKCIGNYFVKPKNGEKNIDVATFINKAIFYLWNDVFKDEKNEVFEENSSYEDFFPIKTKGVQKLKELLERIEVNINTTQEDTPPIEDEVTN